MIDGKRSTVDNKIETSNHINISIKFRFTIVLVIFYHIPNTVYRISIG